MKNIYREKIFNDIKKNHDKYFVTYRPINIKSEKLASLEIVFAESVDIKEVVNIMEKELDKWILKYPLPIITTSFDNKGDVISLKDTKENNYLVGYLNKESNKIVKFWNLNALPKEELTDSDISLAYKGLSHRRRTCIEKDIENKIRKKVKVNKLIKIFFDTTLLLWLAVSIAIPILGLKNLLVGAAAGIYSVYRTIRRFFKLKGYKTKREKEDQEKTRKMNHYYYHCERNPKGFRRLRAENFEEVEKERIKKERENIKN